MEPLSYWPSEVYGVHIACRSVMLEAFEFSVSFDGSPLLIIFYGRPLVKYQ